MKGTKTTFLIFLFCSFCMSAYSQQPIKVVIAGLSHDHVHNILKEYNKGTVTLIGIVEADKSLQEKYSKLYHVPQELFSDDLPSLLSKKKPDVVLGYNPVAEHVNLVRVCAPLKIPVMVEKPLAATLDQAREIAKLAAQYNVQVLTNYETTWYPSYHEVYKNIENDSIGSIKKMVVHDGHQGPKEIGCSKEFLDWLTDPVKNGAGALNDFGCYGADLMTWLMKGQRPIAVTAIARHYKPSIYPKVEDDATIILEYPQATGQIEASWNWPYSIKDLEVFGEKGYYHALNSTDIFSRMRENKTADVKAQLLEAPLNDPIIYLKAVLKQKINSKNDLSSLTYNMIVMEILDAAKRSVKEGRRIIL
ncbi:Gfo/Idh/MocA family oxidoreductase [Pedobacter sp. HMF7647]|uniref:Gfo/Idh/MocA family oxidoreductase n=1 Tax=Hufsiella arboris TaxID=2695275 RepID=A0A7K1Y9W3_9SPHI|nr:Gfo/Idh/MocA family oxidoreductase [Hufsiella arboris]MXV51131.1 Gfo/Idh/MocA family oxidoreductase [Hufsiella arboris]